MVLGPRQLDMVANLLVLCPLSDLRNIFFYLSPVQMIPSLDFSFLYNEKIRRSFDLLMNFQITRFGMFSPQFYTSDRFF